MSYIGREPQVGNFQVCDAISVVNGQAAYTMQVSSVNVVPETANHMIVSLNGIIQAPGSSYTVSGSTITFASNLATGDVIDFIHILGSVLDLGVPSDSTVSLAKLTATGTKDATTFLRGDNTFAAAGGGNNSPSFRAEVASAQSISDATATVIGFGTETFDNGSCYDGTNKFTVPSGEAGKYVVYSQCNLNPSDLNYASNLSLYLYKNGSRWTIAKTDFRNNTGSSSTIIVQDTMDLSVGDYIQIYAYIDTTSGTPSITGQSNLKSVFSAYKIIE
jgi:hypothetical protein